MKKKDISLFNEIKVLFSGWGIVSRLFLLFSICAGYLYFTTANLKVSVFLGVVGACWLFISFVLRNKRLKTYQQTLHDLLTYAINVKFHLGTGKNVLYSLEEASNVASDLIKKDIDRTVAIKREKGNLDTKHFDKHDFPALDIFHQTLRVRDEKGPNKVSDDFKNVVNTMSFEVSKRDELYRGKKGYAQQINMLLGIVLFIPIILNTITRDLYQIFLSVPASTVIEKFDTGHVLLYLR